MSDALVGDLIPGRVVMDQRGEQIELSHDVASPRAARAFVSRVLQGWGVNGTGIERFQLLVSELVSNAVLHGAGTIQISVSERALNAAVVRVAVRNEGHGQPVMRHAERNDLSGRGLQLIDELSQRWGSDAADGHTVVWFEGDPRPA
ncbi:MAG: ATP-binding protein [Ilumatobacteraceae bacterium]